MDNLAEFDDYRVFLRTLLKKKKGVEANYSQSDFAREMGIRPNRLSEVLQKKQGLSGKVAVDIAKRLKLSQQQTKYFFTCNWSGPSESTTVESQAGRPAGIRVWGS